MVHVLLSRVFALGIGSIPGNDLGGSNEYKKKNRLKWFVKCDAMKLK